MFSSLVGTFLRKAAYGALGALALFLASIKDAPMPHGDALVAELWKLAIVPAVTGLAGVLKRLANGQVGTPK